MKRMIITAAALALFACSAPVKPTGEQAGGPAWLFLEQGPVTLNTKVKFAGDTQLQLVRDLSLMAEQPDIVLTKEVSVGPDSLLSVELGDLPAGFYEVRLADSIRFNIGVRPDEVVSPPDAKKDFKAFWKATIDQMEAEPLEVTWEPVPEQSNSFRETFRVSFNSWDGGTAGGIIAIPVKPGKYPVHIQYMGYGAEPFYFYPSANPDRIDFLVSVRGQGIFKEPEARWIDRGLESKETQYYRGAYADAKRAVDFAASLEKADTKRMVAYGESQGGALTVVAAALDHRIRAIAPAVPFMADFRDYGKIVWWPVHEFLEAADQEGLDRDAVLDVMSYFDTKNFAPMVKCPALMAFGLQDPTCPPHTNFAIYNNLGSSYKHFVCVPTCGHAMWEEACWPPVRQLFLDRCIAQ